MRFISYILFLALILSTPLVLAQQICKPLPKTATHQRFMLNADNTVTDLHTRLMWKRCVEGVKGEQCDIGNASYFSWAEALDAAKVNRFAHYSDWRVPNIKELASIIEFACDNPAINLAIFPNVPTQFIWSSSPVAYVVENVWGINFTHGNDTHSPRVGYPHYVLLVRDMVSLVEKSE